MGEEYRGRVFRSGNSLALRLPKALGFVEGTEVRLVHEAPATVRIEPVVAPRRPFNIDKVAGSATSLSMDPDRTFVDRTPGWLDEDDRAA
jgi:antitoxin VapB